MLTYKSLEIVGESSKNQDGKKSNDITHKHIENMQKLFRTHRAALDFDKGFIVASLQSGKDFDLKQEVEIGPRKKKRGRNSMSPAAQLPKRKMQFINRQNSAMIEQERELKRSGTVDSGTTGLTRAQAGADYRLSGKINSLDSRNVKTGMVQRYTQISFEMTDLESGEIVWSGIYEFSRAAADDVIYL